MLNEYLTQFLQHLKYERNLSPHTLRNYASDLEQFGDYLFRVESVRTFPSSRSTG
ncbi:MAG: site-specific integrase [Chloracidobacterium sp.]|nr:site-specific integrase [Chloracidobacterium sp.]